ncbi:hypothetical protein ES288_D03G129400v1 [Gossypium darwinii]|uniref:DNA-directed RNA polymerase RpoA/D/Rpb3-type domain-containing protein n=1 Tax=Gossypium darwinii TaxID=34276 RepID=A0A5D2D7L2_GOSDA|nr:hypothetical protein ES288_D03G129400v1 [Gossypium darwinii]TYG76642.1 hypothetical protein ES288_D03G129400v1 [Gossypium darwinii]
MAEGVGEEKKKFSIWDLPDVPMGQLPPHLELQRSRVSCNKDAPIHTESIQYSGAYASMGIDNSSRLDRFSNNFRVEVVRLNEDDMEFDMIGTDAAIANSFSGILIAEKMISQMKRTPLFSNSMFSVKEVVHVLKWLPNGSELVKEARNVASDSSSKPETYTYFGCSQETIPEFVKNPIIPKYPDIIIAKLGPGQEIELEAHAVKGIGKTHAKWSPVATAWYRMLPELYYWKISKMTLLKNSKANAVLMCLI